MTFKIKIAFVFVALVSTLGAQTQIYRSMQVNKTAAIATNGIGTLTISGTTATFSGALPDSIGVGDVINYNATLSIAFIHGRTSSTVYTVKTTTGGTPTAIVADAGWNIYRAYTSMQGWENGSENTGIPIGVRNFDGGNRNLVTNDETWNIAWYRSTETATLSIAGWTRDATHRLRIYAPYATSEVGTTQRHLGVNSGVRCIMNNTVFHDDGAAVNQQIVWEGIVFQMESLNCSLLIFGQGTSSSVCEVKDCVFVGRDGSGCSTSSEGIATTTTYAGTTKISNTIFYNWDGSGANTGSGSHDAIEINGGTAYIYNCTVYGSNFSFRRTSGTAIVKNSISQATDTDGWTGTFDATSDYNVSERASDAPGSNSKQSTTVTFLSVGGLNFHLNSGDTGAGNSGTDLSADANLPVTTDIDREARPLTLVDMGADEGVAAPAEMDMGIADGDATPSTSDSTDFGTVNLGQTRSVTYTITNSGGTALTLSGTPKVAVSGTHSSDFTVTTQPSSPVSANSGTTTFVVKFTPSATGVRSAALSITNDDANENPYNFSIQGTGGNSAVSKRKYFLRRNQ